MKAARRSYSLSSRLTRMNLLVSGTVLLIAAIAFFSYDLLSFRHNLISNMEAEAQIIGGNSVSALLFNDQQSATSTLESLEGAPDVVGAVLRTSDGAAFAQYGPVIVHPQPRHKLAANEMDHWWPVQNRRVLVAHRVVFQGKAVGIVYIVGSLQETTARARRYGLIALAILVFCMLAATLVSSVSQRLIAEPISELADTALTVSRKKDYSLRADIAADSAEITVLVDAFNTMLSQIQERDAALTEARDQLELRVEERTSELQAANRELEAFSYTVAHDLRGPLDAIAGIVFLLAQGTETCADDASRQMLAQLKISTGNMAALIDDLLNFSRASTVPLKRQPVDLTKIVCSIAEELQALNPTRPVKFVVHDTPQAEADQGLIRIVLDNLLRNAWKYTSNHAMAHIEFGSELRNGVVVYFIRDDGAGFDPARSEALFKPFSRLHGKAEFPGTGVGLATVARILARQGGRIWAIGAIEKGATFYFTL